jgi:hypothetical protein
VHTKHEFLPPEPFLRFSQRTCPIHYFRSKTHVWDGFAQFRCRTSPIPKTGVGCIQSTSFCHGNHFFVFCNEHAQSTTLGPKLMFEVVSLNIVVARHPFRKWVSGCIKARVFGTGTISSFLQRTCPIHDFRTKTHVWGGFTQFRCRTSPIPKTGVECIQSTSFCHRNHFFVFRNEHAQSTTLGPKLMFVVVSRKFVAARHPFGKRLSGCIQSTSFCHRNHFFVFRNEHAQFTTLGPKLMFGRFRVISLSHITHSENGCRVHTKHEFLPPEPFLRFSQRTCPIHYFSSKTHVWGGFAQFCRRTSPIPKTGVGSIKARVFATGTISLFFATNMPNPLL